MSDPARSTPDLGSFEAARRLHLIEATIETLGELGFRAASLGEIARRAKVSPGLFAHYFGDKDGLLEATLRFMAARLTRATAQRMRAAPSALDRVLAVSEAALAPEEFDPRVSSVWLAFWGQLSHSEPYRRVQSIYQRRMRSNLRHGLRALVAQERVESCATLIAATIDGLWLQSHSDQIRWGDSAAARATVRDLAETLIAAHGLSAAPGAPPVSAPIAATAHVSDWARIPHAGRAEILREAAARLRAERAAIALLEARDAGRPARHVEVFDIPSLVRGLERAADLATAPSEDRVALGRGVWGVRTRAQGSGVAEIAAHEAAPLLTAGRDLAVALGSGRSALLRMSARRSRSLERVAALLREAGAPDDALTLRFGDETACAAPRAFAAVVLDGADAAEAARVIVQELAPRAAGLSAAPILVASRLREPLIAGLRDELSRLTTGDPLAEDSDVGPLPSRAALTETLARIGDAQSAGARLHLGGHAVDRAGRAAYLAPTLLEVAHPAITLIAAPVALVTSVEDDAAAARLLRALWAEQAAVFGGSADRLRELGETSGLAALRDGCALGRFNAAIEDWLDPWRREPGARLLLGT